MPRFPESDNLYASIQQDATAAAMEEIRQARMAVGESGKIEQLTEEELRSIQERVRFERHASCWPQG